MKEGQSNAVGYIEWKDKELAIKKGLDMYSNPEPLFFEFSNTLSILNPLQYT
jgi:hypothetical protein